MATRRLRLALWQHRRSLRRQATVQEDAAEHLIGLAGILANVGRPETARRWTRDRAALAGIALRFRAKAICLRAEANALNWRAGQLVGSNPSTSGVRGCNGHPKASGSGSAWRGEEADDLPGG